MDDNHSTPLLRESWPYDVTEHGLFASRATRDGIERKRIANFAAWIAAERIIDDGAERQKFMDIEAEIRGRRVHFTIPVAAFAAMNWPIEHIGVDAVVEPGFGNKEQVRAAIQYLSGAVSRHHTYAHTGWRKFDAHGWCYLHPNGAISAAGPISGIDVKLPEALVHYSLPQSWTREELQAAMRASLQLLDIAPDRVTVPLLGATYRAALGGADFSLHLAGHTGSGKSELAALSQQHYGPSMTSRRLPGAWFSTANHLEALAFATKDAVFVIDEFVIEGSAANRANLQQTFARLVRGVGNGAGRGRADKYGRPRSGQPPRGMIISTGEEIPSGQSLRARMLVIQVERNMICGGDLRALTPLQEAALSGQYATAMAGFIHWFANDFEARQQEFATEVAIRRKKAPPGAHARTMNIGLQLGAIWQFIAQFALECGAINEVEAVRYMRRADDAIALIGEEQVGIQAASDPAQRFCELLSSVVASGRAHIADPNGQAPTNPAAMGWRKVGINWQPLGFCIGWEDGSGGLFLEPEASFAAVQAMGDATDDRLGGGGWMLRKLLHERGLLLTVETEAGKTHRTIRRTIDGRRRRVLHVPNLLNIPED
ncbi:MAG: DUF927 domain-containing protein [Alphaproteobacteria bacterium]